MVKSETFLQRCGLTRGMLSVHWNTMRSFFIHSTQTLSLSAGLTLHDWNTRNNLAERLLHFTLPELSSGKAPNKGIHEIVEELRLSGDMQRCSLRLQQQAKLAAAQLSWHRSGKQLCRALGLQPAAGRSCSALVPQLPPVDTNMLTRLDTLCSSRVIMKWIEEQRLTMQNMAQQGALQSPVMLDLRYCGPQAANDKPIVLLDQSIHVQPDGVYAYQHQGELARYVNNWIMVSAMRAAALLKLPVHMSLAVPLTNEHAELSALSSPDNVLLVCNINYTPRTLCDIESYGTKASKALAFNVLFPIWQHFNLPRNASSGLLEPLWLQQPQQPKQSMQQLHADQHQQHVVHADCSDAEFAQLLQLAEHNVVPHLLSYNQHSGIHDAPVRFFSNV